MAAPVEVDFLANGIQSVLRGFDTVEDRMVRFERQAVSQARAGGEQREQVARQTTRRVLTEEEKLAKAQKEEWAKAAKEAAAWAKQREQIVTNSAKMSARLAAQEAREEARVAQQLEREKRRIEEEHQRWKRSMVDNTARMTARAREQEMAAEERDATARVRLANRIEASGRRRFLTGIGGAAEKSVSGMVGGAMTLGVTALALGGGMAVSNAMSNEMRFTTAAAQAANEAFVEGDKDRTRSKASPAIVAALARHAALATNTDKTEVAEAIKEYVGKSSDFEGISKVNKDTGRTNLETLLMMAKGTGGDPKSIITAAASLKASNAKMTTEEMMTTMYGITGAGKKGNLPIEELASVVPDISAASKIFAGNATENQRKLLGFTQLIGPATGGAAEAAMALKHVGENAMIAARTGKGGLQASDIYVGGDSSKGLVDPATLMANLFRRTKGKFDVAQEILGERGFKGFEALTDEYRSQGGGEKGAKAVEAKVKSFENVTYSDKSVVEDFTNVMSQDGEGLHKALAELQEEIATEATPILKEFVGALKDHKGDIVGVIREFGKLASWLASDPIMHALELMAAKLIADVTLAGIGVAIKAKIIASIAEAKLAKDLAAAGGGGGGAAVPGVPGAASAAGGGLGAALGVGTALAVAGGLAYAGVNAYQKGQEAERADKLGIDQLTYDAAKHQRHITAMTADIQSGTLNADERAVTLAEREHEEKARDADIAKLKSLGVNFDPLKDAIIALTKTIEKHGKTLVESPPDVLSPGTRVTPHAANHG